MKKFTLILLAFLLIFTEVFGYLGVTEVGVAYADNTAFADSPSADPGEIKKVYDVIALVVNNDLFDDGSTYDGVMEIQYANYLAGDDTMKDRIDRYAADVQTQNPGSIVKILRFDPSSDTLLSLITALENLYKNGVDEFSSRLTGAVLIGEIPLPVVNKNGNRFISMFPLTDFDEKAYVFNPVTSSFDRVADVSQPKAEIWHGVLREPNGDTNALATFFDKNHLYHQGVEEFSDFDKKLFYADLVAEEKSVNEDAFVAYQRFLKNMEDLAYLRYSTKWAASLSKDTMGDLAAQGIDFSQIFKDEDGNPIDLGSDAQWKEQFDINTKTVIDSSHKAYIDAVSGLINNANELGEQTGRYDVANNEVVNIPELVSMKDSLAQAYLRNANDALEKKTDEIIEAVSRPMPLLAGSTLSILDLEGKTVAIGNFRNGFVNDKYGDKLFINGTSQDDFYTPKQSYPLLGTMYVPESSTFTTLTRSVGYNSVSTARTRYGLGVNGFTLSKSEAEKISGGVMTSGGFLIGKRTEYGIPAFFNKSPLKNSTLTNGNALEKGDVIISVKGSFVSYQNEEGTIGGKYDCDWAESYNADMSGAVKVKVVEDGEETFTKTPKRLNDAIDAMWQKVQNKDTFGGEDEDHFYCVKSSSVTVNYYDASSGDLKSFDLSLGKLVPIYSLGSNADAYANNDLFGCFMGSAILNDDRCFAKFASYPTIDPSGSYEPYYRYGVLMKDENGEITIENSRGILQTSNIYPVYDGGKNANTKLTLKENTKVEDLTDEEKANVVYDYEFPVGASTLYEMKNGEKHYYWHYPQFQLPSGRSFYDVDEIYFDECFNMLPTYGSTFKVYIGGGFGTKDFESGSVYDSLLNSVRSYTNSSGKNNNATPYGGNGPNALPLTSTKDLPMPGTLDGLPATDATLAYLASIYGLWDGIDNDGNEITDYLEKDMNGDGVPGLYVDVKEMDPKYGLDPNNISMVGRKLLGPNYKYKTPSTILNAVGNNQDIENGPYYYPLPDATGKVIGILKIEPQALDSKKTISSLIRHNEPTNYTISKEWESKAAKSLPIDNPRYVAFLDQYGDVQKVDYPNLFKATSSEEFAIQVRALVEEYIIPLPGVEENLEKIDELSGSTLEQKINYLINELTKISINSGVEDFKKTDDMYRMITADGFMLRDAIDWNGRSIDDKHEYILNHYLNEEENAYVEDSTKGYETAYLVLNGGSDIDSDYYDTSFNKEPLKEVDATFDPFAPGMTYEDAFLGVDENGYPLKEKTDDGGGGSGFDEGFVYVPITEFFNELRLFVKNLEKFVSDMKDIKSKDVCASMAPDSDSTLADIIMTPSKNSAKSGGEDYIELAISALDADGLAYVGDGTDEVILNISQDASHPIFEIDLADKSKVLKKGAATYRLYTTQYSGDGSVSVTVNGVASDGVSISSTPDAVSLTADSDSITAGSTDFVTLTASLERDGELDSSASNEVTFEISDESIATFNGSDKSKAVNGIATIKLYPKTKSGIITVSAKVSGADFSSSNFSDSQKEIYVIPDATTKIAIEADTNVLEANNQSKANLKFTLYDKYGNHAVDTFEKIVVFAVGDAEVDKSSDSDTTLPGVQLTTDGGFTKASLRAKDVTGKVDVYVLLQDYSFEEELAGATNGDLSGIDLNGKVGATKEFEILKGLQVQVASQKSALNVGETDSTKISAILTDASGAIQNGYNGPVTFTVNDPLRGTLSFVPSKMADGSASATLTSTTKSGDTEISVSVPGFADATQKVVMLPGPATSISLTSEDGFIYTTSPTGTILKAELKDQYDNIATGTDAPIVFGASSGSQHLVLFESHDPYATSGIANATIKSTGASGKVNLIAESPSLISGALSLDIKKRVKNDLYDKFAPKTLYMNLLGGNFYDLGTNDMAASLLYNGKTQAILTATASIDDKKREVFVDGYGYIEVLDQNLMSTISNDSSGIKVKFTDTVYNEELGEVSLVPKSDLRLAIVEDFADSLEGILAKSINESGDKKAPVFELSDDGQTIYLKDGDNVLMSLNKGIFTISDDNLVLRIPEKDEAGIDKGYFSLVVMFGGKVVGQVMFKQDYDGGVNVKVNSNSHFAEIDAFSRYSTQFRKGSYIVDVNKPLEASMTPGFGSTSIESAKKDSGVGLRYDNKNLLLFVAGSSVGEANIPYASEVGVVVGDPTIRLSEDKIPFSSLSGFDPTVGKHLFSGEHVIKDIIPFDYNGDGYEDILLSYDSGELRLLENEISSKRFTDRGDILALNSGVESLTKIDVDNNGYDDLIIGTKEACKKGEPCLSLYKNEGGRFVMQTLKLSGIKPTDRLYQMKADDLNNDQFPDLVVSNSGGEIYIYWNRNGTIDETGIPLWNFGVNVDGVELVDNLVVNYGGMPTKPAANTDPNSDAAADPAIANYVSLSVTSETDEESKKLAQGEGALDNVSSMVGEETYPKSYDFIAVSRDTRLKAGSSKKIIDVNGGGSLNLGDVVQYHIVLKNNSSSGINGLMLSDVTPTSQKIDEASVKCADPSCTDDLKFSESFGNLRTRVIKGISVPPNGIRNITYIATITDTAKVSFDIGDFEKGGYVDNYKDILVRPDVNQTDSITYFYSNNTLDSLSHVQYIKNDTPIEKPVYDNPDADKLVDDLNDFVPPESSEDVIPVCDTNNKFHYYISDEDGSVSTDDDENNDSNSTMSCECSGPVLESEGIPESKGSPYYISNEDDENFEECCMYNPDGTRVCDEGFKIKNPTDIPDSVSESVEFLDQDEDGDGLPDYFGVGSLSSGLELAEKISMKVATAISSLRCGSAGCLPNPYNYAFLAATGTPPAVTGTAVFAWGTPNLPFFSFMYPSDSISTGRFYVSPTLTLGLGIGLCVGGPTGSFGMCWPASIPTGKLISGVCKAVQNGLTAALDSATSFASSVSGGNVTLMSNGSANGPSDVNSSGSWGGGDMPLQVDYSANIKIPGFPAVLTNWLDAEIEEIYNKLLDLPDFYFIFPEIGSLLSDSANALGAITSVKNRYDLMTVLTSIPLIQIRGEEVLIKIPSINGDQIVKWQRQANAFIENLEREWEKTKEYWSCAKTEHKTVCDAMSFKLTATIKQIKDVLDALENFKNLPKQLMKWRGMEQKYATQIICYLDAVMDMTGGYMKRQSRIISSWIRMISDVTEQLKSWSALLNLSVDYQASCDKCTTDKFTLINTLFQLFGALPDLPVVPFPKWPDFVFDFSKLELGAEIIWPDLVFKPQPITLPDLPIITLPHAFPEINVDLDGLIPDIKIDFPNINLNFNLPDLPPLPLPKLPDLPKPPKIPKLPSAIYSVAKDLKTVFKILCLLKQGLIPIPEGGLKDQIEILTEPSAKATIPFTLGFAVNMPSISYSAPAEFDFTLKTKFGIGTSAIYQAVKSFAADYNEQVEKYVGEINGYTQNLKVPYIENLDQTLKEKFGIPPKIDVDAGKMKGYFKDKSSSTEGLNKVIYLAAEPAYFDAESAAKNKNLEDLDEINVDELSAPYMKRIAQARNNLLSFATNDDEGSTTLLASNDVSTLPVSDVGTQIIKVSMTSTEIALAPPKIFDGLGLSDMKDLGMPSSTPPGTHLFVEGADGKQTENILYYTYELGKENHILSIDVDNDSDEDLIYSMGSDLYLKSNRFEEPDDLLEIVPASFPYSDVSDYSSDGTLSVQRVMVSANDHNSSTIKFEASVDPNVVGYEVFVVPSLTDMDSNTFNGTRRYLLTKDPENVFGVVDNVVNMMANTTAIKSSKRTLYSSGEEFSASAGDVLHATSSSQFVMKMTSIKGEEITQNSELPNDKFYLVSTDTPNVNISLVDGGIELITNGSEKTTQPLIEGMGIVLGDEIIVGENGGASISFNNGASIEVQTNETFSIEKLVNDANPSIDVSIPDGNYHGVVYSIRNDGIRSFVSTQSPVAPQICGDDTPPLPALSNTELYVPITKTLKLDASASFDPNGEIEKYYIDSNLEKDSNNDGNPKNDPDPSDPTGLIPSGKLWDYDNGNPSKFLLGPFFKETDEDGFDVALNIIDTGGNNTTQNVKIHVYIPSIKIDPVKLEDGMVTGSTTPPSGNMPYALMRKRFVYRVQNEELLLVDDEEQIKTLSSDINGQYSTDSDGTYKIDDFNLNDIIDIHNGVGDVIGEIDASSDNFWLRDGYTYKIVPATPPTKGTYIEIFDASGKSMGKIYVVANNGSAVKIQTFAEFTYDNTQNLYGVHVIDSPQTDDFEFRSYPSNDPNYPNGVYLYYKPEKKHMAAVDTSGNVLLIDERITINKKENQFNSDPLVYELKFNNVKVGEVYVSPRGKFDEAQIVGPKDVPYQFPKSVTPQYLYEDQELAPNFYSGNLNPTVQLFTDLTGNLYDYAMSLYKQGLISGEEKFNPNELLARADFVVTLLHMLCIVPRTEAYEAPPVFDDMPFTNPTTFYYPYVKEGSLLGLVSGYGSETAGASGLNPFKPAATITLAEAIKVIIEGLEMNGALDLSKVSFAVTPGSPWYLPYMKIAVNLAPYAKRGVILQNSFVITPEEAKFPNKQLTRGQILEITYRVIDAYNCTELDANNNGMKDYCERKYDISNPDDDPDKDGLTNADECFYGTDPNKYDTDDGGVGDGDEVNYSTNPLIGADDQNDTDGDGLLDIEERTIYHTDPNDPDTDDGGVYDGYEVQHQTDPLYKEDDYSVGSQQEGGLASGQTFEEEAGIYIVPGECDTCPCNNTYKYKSDLRKGDVLYTIIVNQDYSRIYAKSNETKVY